MVDGLQRLNNIQSWYTISYSKNGTIYVFLVTVGAFACHREPFYPEELGSLICFIWNYRQHLKIQSTHVLNVIYYAVLYIIQCANLILDLSNILRSEGNKMLFVNVADTMTKKVSIEWNRKEIELHL